MTKEKFIKSLKKLCSMQEKLKKSSHDFLNEIETEFDVSLDDILIDENTTLGEAIDCHISYGEYDAKSLWESLQKNEEKQ